MQLYHCLSFCAFQAKEYQKQPIRTAGVLWRQTGVSDAVARAVPIGFAQVEFKNSSTILPRYSLVKNNDF